MQNFVSIAFIISSVYFGSFGVSAQLNPDGACLGKCESGQITDTEEYEPCSTSYSSPSFSLNFGELQFLYDLPFHHVNIVCQLVSSKNVSVVLAPPDDPFGDLLDITIIGLQDSMFTTPGWHNYMGTNIYWTGMDKTSPFYQRIEILETTQELAVYAIAYEDDVVATISLEYTASYPCGTVTRCFDRPTTSPTTTSPSSGPISVPETTPENSSPWEPIEGLFTAYPSPSPTPKPTDLPTHSPTTIPSPAPSTSPTSPPTPSPTSSPVYKNEFARDVYGFQCKNVDCDDETRDGRLGLTPGEACHKCPTGGYIYIRNENDESQFAEDINLQRAFMFSFWMTIPEGSAIIDLVRFRYFPNPSFARFLYVQDASLKLQYPINGTFATFVWKEFEIDNGEPYTFQLSTKDLFQSRQNLQDESVIIMQIELVVYSRKKHKTKTWRVAVIEPRLIISGYEIHDSLQAYPSDFAFGYHTMSQKESEIAHASNMANWPPILEKEAYDVVPLISIGGLGILLFSMSLSFNFYYGHELPRVMFVLGPTLALLDFFTDAQLCWALWEEEDSSNFHKTCGLFIIIAPFILNLLIILHWYCQNVGVASFVGRWIRKKFSWICFIICASTIHVGIIQITWSYLFPYSYFTLPILADSKLPLLRWGCVISTFVENIPSLALQISLISQHNSSEKLDDAVYYALYFTCLSLIRNIVGSILKFGVKYETPSLRFQACVTEPSPKLLYRRRTIYECFKKLNPNSLFDVIIFKGGKGTITLEILIYDPCISFQKAEEDIEEILKPYFTEQSKINFIRAGHASRFLELILAANTLSMGKKGGIKFTQSGTLEIDMGNIPLLPELRKLLGTSQDAFDWQETRVAMDIGLNLEKTFSDRQNQTPRGNLNTFHDFNNIPFN